MMSKIAKLFTGCFFALGIAAGAMAAPINTNPITSDYYIEYNGLYWAWASPVSDQYFAGGINELYLPGIQDGWRFATDDEWALRPAASDFGTPNNLKCASQFWNSLYSHCDYANFVDGAVSHKWGYNIYDLFYVKDIQAPGGDVPAPGALSLLGLALAGLGMVRRKRA